MIRMENENKYLDILEVSKKLMGEMEFRAAYLNEWIIPDKPQRVYILASNERIARNIFNHYFLYTGISQSNKFSYVNADCESLRGIKNQYIVVSNERFPHHSFYDRLRWIHAHSQIYGFEVIDESDLENEQVRQKVSGQRQIQVGSPQKK